MIPETSAIRNTVVKSEIVNKGIKFTERQQKHTRIRVLTCPASRVRRRWNGIEYKIVCIEVNGTTRKIRLAALLHELGHVHTLPEETTRYAYSQNQVYFERKASLWALSYLNSIGYRSTRQIKIILQAWLHTYDARAILK